MLVVVMIMMMLGKLLFSDKLEVLLREKNNEGSQFQPPHPLAYGLRCELCLMSFPLPSNRVCNQSVLVTVVASRAFVENAKERAEQNARLSKNKRKAPGPGLQSIN